jgi:catechol 2,3-dioxygenase-like lactoylglutathione lyase family enzyme
VTTRGGAPEGTPEIYVGDPDGTVVQIQDPSYCGGSGVLGNVCSRLEPSPVTGLFKTRDLSHFTIRSADAQRANAFYQGLFGLSIRAYQGPTPALAVGAGVQFVMFTGGAAGRGAAPARPPAIDHVCLGIDDFDVDRILKTLEGYGIKPRGSAAGPAGPMTSYVSMRMENRGGAPGGTP